MIHFDRSRISVPDSLQWIEGRPAYNEFKDAETFFSEEKAEERRQKRFNFRVYKRPEVRVAVGKVFFEKCAYCDRDVSAFEPFDVDLFRPKSGVMERAGHPGYWWLAMRWNNMVLACADCSRIRDGDGIKTGKSNRFPLRVEANRALSPGEESEEYPLLLDPCNDDPEEHFVYDINTGVMSSPTERGNVTIAVLGLNRPALVNDRNSAAMSIKSLILRYATAVSNGNNEQANASLKEVRKLHEPNQEFAGLKRQMIKAFTDGIIGPHAQNALNEMFGDKSPFHQRRRPGGKIGTRTIQGIPHHGTVTKAQIDAAVKKILDDRKLRNKAETETKKFEIKQASYSLANPADLETYRSQRRLIESIRIVNIKALRNLKLDLTNQSGKTPWYMLLGENGTGKSTMLQAATLALLGREAFLRLVKECALHPKDFLSSGYKRAAVEVKLSGFPLPHKLAFTEDRIVFTNPLRKKTTVIFTAPGTAEVADGGGEWEPQILLLAYGATRLLPRKTGKRPRAFKDSARVHNLFDPFMPLIDPEKWLLRLYKKDRARFDDLALILKDLISLKKDVRLEPEGTGFVVVDKKERIPLRQLSDGYQSMIAMTIDILEVALRLWHSLQDAEGIILLDELGAHLHPAWKMRVVDSLRRALPAMQFVVTTHDPLCLRGLEKGEVAVMRRDEKNRVLALSDLPSPGDFRVDQLLTSEFFGLNSTIDPVVEAEFNEYYKLLALKKPGKTESGRLAEIQDSLKARRYLGVTQRENIMYAAIDRILADNKADNDPLPPAELKKKAVAEVTAIWQKHLAAAKNAKAGREDAK